MPFRVPEGGGCNKSGGFHGGGKTKNGLLGYNGRSTGEIKGWLRYFLKFAGPGVRWRGVYQTEADLPQAFLQNT
jgi:hypothetical protein